MAFYKVTKKQEGGGGVTILTGASNPTASQGVDGQIYLKTLQGEKVTFNGFGQLKEASMNVSVESGNVTFAYTSGANIGAQVYKQFDLTDVDAIKITVATSSPSYDNYSTPRFSPILLIENTINPANTYPVNTSIVSANGETYRVTTQGDTVTFEADVSELTGNYWVILSSVGDTSVWSDLYFLSNSMDNVVCGDYAKVNGAWQNLLGTNIDDIQCGVARGNATVKRDSFVSASTQYGIVDINVGFEPDLVLVEMPLGNNVSTVSYWEKDLSYAQTDAIWCLKPAENVAYQVALDRQTGETGIQAINNDGFSFMSNGANTRGITCEYIAVKYEAEPTPNPLVFKNYAKFDGVGITLPFTINSDYKVSVTYHQTSYLSPECIIGNTSGAGYSHFTVYNNQYWSSAGTGESGWGTWSAGEHTFVTNDGNGYNTFDGSNVQSYNPTTSSGKYTIGIRANTSPIVSYIKSYTIESISTGDKICELKPCEFEGNSYLYDTVAKRFYYVDGLTVMDTIPTT